MRCDIDCDDVTDNHRADVSHVKVISLGWHRAAKEDLRPQGLTIKKGAEITNIGLAPNIKKGPKCYL